MGPLTLMAIQYGLQGVLGGIEKKAEAKRIGKTAAANERIALRTAEDISSVGATSEIRARRQGQKILASLQSRLAEAGIDTTEGFGLNASLALMNELELEFGDIRQQTQQDFLSMTDQAAGFARQKKDAKAAEKKAFFGGIFGG